MPLSLPFKGYPFLTLAGVAQLVGHQSPNQKVAGLIPCWATCLACGFGETTNRYFSPSLSPSLLLSLKSKIKLKYFFKKGHASPLYLGPHLLCYLLLTCPLALPSFPVNPHWSRSFFSQFPKAPATCGSHMQPGPQRSWV